MDVGTTASVLILQLFSDLLNSGIELLICLLPYWLMLLTLFFDVCDPTRSTPEGVGGFVF